MPIWSSRILPTQAYGIKCKLHGEFAHQTSATVIPGIIGVRVTCGDGAVRRALAKRGSHKPRLVLTARTAMHPIIGIAVSPEPPRPRCDLRLDKRPPVQSGA